MRKGPYFAYASMWISTAVAVSVGIWVTHSAWCLRAMFIPAMVKASFGVKENEDEKE